MAWGFLTKHAQALLCIANDPGVRLREVATILGITERAAFGIVTDLVNAGYVLKDKQGRRNRYEIQLDRPLPEALLRRRTVGKLLDLLSVADESSPDRTWAPVVGLGRPPGCREQPGPALPPSTRRPCAASLTSVPFSRGQRVSRLSVFGGGFCLMAGVFADS